MKKKNKVNDAQRANKLKLFAQSDNQQKYIDAIKEFQQVFAIGPAGSGKTFIPTMIAMKMYLRGDIDKIILTRPAVPVGEQHGFLPGDINKKLAPWVIPVTEIIEECLGSKARFEDMLRTGDLEIAPFAYMRGRTFRNSFVILDEAQNTSDAQMEMFLTRLADDAHVVISGDIRQSDMNNYGGGLKTAVDLIEKHNIPAKVIRMTSEDSAARGELCRKWVEAYEQKEKPPRRFF